ncbi:MAG: tetratricopeptide repeat protein [Spirochaetaceae bacterium]|nr:tetratricopeptide repeat protein [Spirochaetaceae bacterium]
MTNIILSKAERAFKSRNFDKVINLLENNVTGYDSSADFFYLLGLSCYYKGDMAGAELYMARALAIARDNTDISLMLAVLALRRRDTANAIKSWLAILELNPDHKKALLAINKLKDIDSPSDLSRFILSKDFKKLLPKIKFYPKINFKILIIILVLSISLALIYLNPFATLFTRPQRSDNLSDITFTAINLPNQFTGSPTLFELSDDEALLLFDEALDYFNNYQDNSARLLLNQIKFSNADVNLRQRAHLLAQSTRRPDFTTPPDGNITIGEVLGQPFLHDGLFVIWRGAISGLTIDEEYNRLAFRLLVGYEDRQLVQGEIMVYVYFIATIEPSLPIDVLGQIAIDNNNQLYLNAVSLRQVINN